MGNFFKSILYILRLIRSKSPILAVDGLILKENKILLVKRAIPPFSGYWTLPGGHVKYGETVEEAIQREMKEELGGEFKIKKLLGVYSDPKRDPRYHSTAVIFLLEKIDNQEIRLNFEGGEYKYFSSQELPQNIGFDHRKIIEDFLKSASINETKK